LEKFQRADTARPGRCDPALLAALDAGGIREPARSRLARCEHVTVELIEYHTQTASAGQAIYRIEHNWPVRSADGDRQERRKYVEGRYAEFVEH
jgi:hypothetical protein